MKIRRITSCSRQPVNDEHGYLMRQVRKHINGSKTANKSGLTAALVVGRHAEETKK